MQVKRKSFAPLCTLYKGHSPLFILSITLTSLANQVAAWNSFTFHMDLLFLGKNHIFEYGIIPLFENIMNWKYLSWMKYISLI